MRARAEESPAPVADIQAWRQDARLKRTSALFT